MVATKTVLGRNSLTQEEPRAYRGVPLMLHADTFFHNLCWPTYYNIYTVHDRQQAGNKPRVRHKPWRNSYKICKSAPSPPPFSPNHRITTKRDRERSSTARARFVGGEDTAIEIVTPPLKHSLHAKDRASCVCRGGQLAEPTSRASASQLQTPKHGTPPPHPPTIVDVYPVPGINYMSVRDATVGYRQYIYEVYRQYIYEVYRQYISSRYTVRESS